MGSVRNCGLWDEETLGGLEGGTDKMRCAPEERGSEFPERSGSDPFKAP